MNDRPADDGSAPARRAERAARARRSRRGVTAAVALTLAVAATAVYVVVGGDEEPARSTPQSGGGAPQNEPALVALQVTGGPAPYLAVVGVPTGGEPFLMPLSSELTLVVPGQGETSAAGVAALPGGSMQLALSNMSGIWIDHFAVMSLRDLSTAIEAAGGMAVELPAAYPTELGVMGPGELTMSGARAKAFLAGATDDASVRWEIVLGALLADPMPLAASGDVDTDDVEAVDDTFARARGADVLDMPTERVTATIVVPVYPALDRMIAQRLGTTAPVGVIVQNGSGEPGVGEAVAARIIPEGFRVVLSQNAQTFGLKVTDVFANGPDHEAEARRVQAALGVGRVRVAAVPSNIGDITIVVGKDFTA